MLAQHAIPWIDERAPEILAHHFLIDRDHELHDIR